MTVRATNVRALLSAAEVAIQGCRAGQVLQGGPACQAMGDFLRRRRCCSAFGVPTGTILRSSTALIDFYFIHLRTGLRWLLAAVSSIGWQKKLVKPKPYHASLVLARWEKFPIEKRLGQSLAG
ncbi:MAG: hypothetical protein C0609_12295 [Deltaproteobacteria bacterium]|nr:MAG: hypothetical protein C0609_12295 [Deltaproteobacteria bacterium]